MKKFIHKLLFGTDYKMGEYVHEEPKIEKRKLKIKHTYYPDETLSFNETFQNIHKQANNAKFNK